MLSQQGRGAFAVFLFGLFIVAQAASAAEVTIGVENEGYRTCLAS